MLHLQATTEINTIEGVPLTGNQSHFFTVYPLCGNSRELHTPARLLNNKSFNNNRSVK